MAANILMVLRFLFFARFAFGFQVIQPANLRKVYVDKDDGKSSLVFVFDTTWSMYNDLRQLREGAEMILKTALEESNIIADFVFVPFNDPAVGPATVTKDKWVFKAALNLVKVYGGGDCPEKSLGGIQMALNVSRPKSFVYVFTDATASDHKLVGTILDMVQQKQSQVVFVLTGHCNDLRKPSYKVYQQIAAASSGQVFNLNKTNVHSVLDFVRSSIKGRTVNLASAIRPAGYNYTQGIKVDKTIGEVTVSVSGAKPQIEVVDPSGEKLTGPPKLVTTLDLSEIMIVKVIDPQPGNWSITVGSEKDYSVKVVGLSDLTFNHGFSVEKTSSMAETTYRPLQGTYNNLMIALSKTDVPVKIDFAEILSLDGKTIFEVSLNEVDSKNKVYLANAFVPPEEFFYIAITGHDEHGQEFRRIGSTAVQAKPPDAPYLAAPQKIQARNHERIVLSCSVESLVPVTAMWTKDYLKIQEQINSLQSTTVEYVIEDMAESHAGTYRCVARNVAGVSKAITSVELAVEPPQITILPQNTTVAVDENLTISCTVLSESPIFNTQIIFSSSERQNHTKFYLEPTPNGIYSFNYTIQRVSDKDGGEYTCVAANRGGQTNQSTFITIQAQPTVQILGPHTLTKLKNTDVQFVCHVEHSSKVQWVGPDDVILQDSDVNGSYNSVLDVTNITFDGTWTCVALRDSYRATDSIQVSVLMMPRVCIDGERNITILNGTSHQVSCTIVAKPPPRILWHRETEEFLNHTVTVHENNTYISVLTLDSAKEQVNGTYFCFGENSEGIDQDSVIVNVRRKMVLLEGFTDQSVELYSQLGLRCRVDSYPDASVTWLHNGTLITDNMAEDQSLLYIQKVDFDDLGLYTCILDNVYEKMEVNGTLGVSGLESPVLSKETLKKKVKKGEAVILTCRVLKGNPEPTIKWEFRSNASTNFTQLPSNVANSDDGYNIEISNVDVEHAGSYRCTANNVIGQDMYEVELVVQFPPKLSTSKESHLEAPIEVKSGDKKVLSCEADGLPPPIVTWTRNDLPISFSNNIHLTDSNELVIENASEYDSGTYTCKVSNALGTETRNFTLLVFSQPEIVPPTTEDVHVLEGQLVELPCVASGTAPLTLTWFHNGGLIASPKKYMDEYGLRFVANLTDFGDYSCYVQNEYGSSAIFYHLYVWVPPHIDGPLEAEKKVLPGANVTLTCDATAFPVPVISWEFEGQLLKENTSSIQFNDVGNLIIKNATSEQTGVYACVADNMVGVERKFTFLRVDEPPTILSDNFTGPYVATSMDTSLSIPCRAVGTPRPYVVWSKEDQYLGTDPRFQIDLEGTLTIKSPSEELSGEYTCIAKNTVGNVTKTVEVRIYSLFNQMQGEEAKSSVSLVEGTKASVHCPIHSAVDQTVKWYKDAVLISNGTLTFQNVSRQNASTYACVVSNAVASAYASVTVTVQWPPCFTEKVKQDVQVVQGNDWYFDCRVDAKPRAKVKWYFNSKLILGEDKDVLKLLNTHLRHTGTYKCVVNNHHGTVLRQFTLDVLVPPSISEFDLLDVQLKAGTNASLECDAKGSPTPEVTWTFNNTHWTQINSSLVSSLVSTESEGVYRCEARNSAGSRTLVYRVSVVSEAAIKEIVAYTNGEGETVTGNLEVTRGTNVRLACQADGNPTPTTQWSKHGNVISENEKGISYADLMLKNVDTAESGVYSCIASNDGGMDERKVKIEVLEPPRIFQELFQNVNSSDNVVNIEVISGQPFYLHCHPSGNPWPEVYWFKDDLPLMFFDDSMVTIDYGETVVARKAKYEQSGNYTCVARNKVGNTSVVYLVDVLVAPPQLKDNMKQVDTPANSALNLTCPVDGSPLPYVVWFKHPYQEITDQTPRINLFNDNYTLIINSTEASDSGKYSCIMTNKVGTTEVVFDVTVEQAPSIAGNDGNNTIEKHVVPLRRSVVLKCEVDGHPTPKISWLKDVQQITDNASTHRVLGNSLLTIWSVGARDAGQYICVAQNRAGTAHKRHNVVVQVPGKWSNWSQWSYCNVTCGLGYQSRTRFCHYIDDDNNTIDKSTKSDKIILDESACKGLTVDSRKCFMPSCEQEAGGAARWTAWSRWSACSAPCGAGTQARTRRCRGARCLGDNVQIRKCPNLPRCDNRFENTASNEVLNSRDHRDIQNPYMPEAIFEMQPEIVESHRSMDVDNAYVSPAMVPQQLYYDINVTRNLDLSTQGPCKPGYRHNTVQGSCEDIDECAVDTNQCHLTQVCVNTLGGYRCTCSPGYVSLGAGQQCLDINECSLGISGCEVGCVNTAGGYACACPPRLRLHADRHHCVPPSMYREPLSEDLRTEDVLSTSVEFPAKYKKLYKPLN